MRKESVKQVPLNYYEPYLKLQETWLFYNNTIPTCAAKIIGELTR